MSTDLISLAWVMIMLLMVAGAEAFGAQAQPVAGLQRAGEFQDAVADSIADYGGPQGSHGWSYGLAPAAAYSPFGFVPCTVLKDGAWHVGGRPLPAITRTGALVGQGRGAVRRWRPGHAGSVRLVGQVRKPGAYSAGCSIYVDGMLHWRLDLAGGDTIPHAFDVLLLDVPQSASVDMVAQTEARGRAVQVDWKLQVLAEPCTAWRPDLPIGPTFTRGQKAAQFAAGQRILESIRHASAAGEKTIFIPPGDYRFPGNGSAVLNDLKDLDIEARGATFWFDNPQVFGLAFQDCRNVTVRGLTIDCDPLPFFQGKITAMDPGTGTLTLQLMPGYDPPGSGGHRTISYYYPDGGYIRNGIIGCKWARRAGTDLVDIKAPAPGVSVGDYAACVIRTGQELRSLNCGGMVYEDCNIYAGGGMAVLESEGPGGSLYRHVRCTRRPGTNRLHAFGADGFHFNALGKGPVLDECEGAYFADDEINIHGKFGDVVKRLGPAQYVMSTESAATFSVGQDLSFWGFVTMDHLGDAKVTAVGPDPDGEKNCQSVTLDHALDLPEQALVDTHSHDSRYFVVKNCWFHDTGQRFLLNGAPYGLIENNTFQNVGGNVDIHEESWNGYTEGAFPSGLVFRNNRLFDLHMDITLQPAGGHYIRRSMPIKDMKILNNYFEGAGPEIIVNQVDGLVIEGNVIDRPFDAPDWKGFGLVDDGYGDVADAPIFLAAVKSARIAGNLVYDPLGHTGGRQVRQGALTSNISINGVMQWNAVADTLSSWRPDPVQGGRGWSYGVVPVAALARGAYSPADFTPLAVEQDGWRPAPGQLPCIQMATMHPTAGQAVVRRWASTFTGEGAVEGAIDCPAAAGATVAYVFVNGQKVWEQDASDHRPHSFRASLHAVQMGALIDLVVGPAGGGAGADTTLYARMMKPPAGQGQH